jgi:IS5 family transposase
VYCISKGKEHKKYEFGNKVSITQTKHSGIIVGAISIPENKYDGATLPAAIAQTKRLVKRSLEAAIVDRGYRGRKKVDGVRIILPDRGAKNNSAYEKRKMRIRFRRRAAIEPVIGHLKSDCRLGRNFLKGKTGDSINVMLAAAAFNFRKFLRNLRIIFCLLKYWMNACLNPAKILYGQA